mgnify:FL=1
MGKNIKSKLFILFISGSILSGCATAYQKTGLSGGFEDVELGGGRYKVTFVGNGYTSDSKAVNYAKRRASELCKGTYDILEQDIEQSFMGKPTVTIIVQCKS